MAAPVQRLIFVGGGPRTTGILLRLAANAQAGNLRLGEIHVIDPYPAGSGRIWRKDQSGLLWMNSMAQDVTIFADESVIMDGPVSAGPRLDEWVLGEGREEALRAGLASEVESFSARSFPSRRMQSLYLDFAFREAVQQLAELQVLVQVHQTRAVSLHDRAGQQLVHLGDGTVLSADTVVLSQGHLDVLQAPESTALSEVAAADGLTYIPPGFTADQDLSGIPAATPALVRGFGLAFIDAMVLLTEGRGGRFRESPDGTLHYLPSGREPQLWVGSRRGVPYQPKINYSSPVFAEPPKFLDDISLSAFGQWQLDYRRHILPLLTWNLQRAHYQQLHRAHPERTTVGWEEIDVQLHRLLPSELGGQERATVQVRSFMRGAVPDPADRFNFDALNQPLKGLHFGERAGLENYLLEYISGRIQRSDAPRFSMDLAVFQTLLQAYQRIHELGENGRFSLADLRENINRHLHSLFSYLASGPPPIRLRQLLALHRSDVVRFLGPEVRIGLVDGHFIAESPALPGETIRSRTLIDAFLADNSASAVDDELLQRLLSSGEVTVESAEDKAGVRGKFLVDTAGHPVQRDGSVHPHRFLLGPMVSGGGAEGPFSRPGINARGFRRADTLARLLLGLEEKKTLEKSFNR